MAEKLPIVWAARLAVIAAGAHACLFAVLHVLEPELSPISSIISDYATTGHAWVATAAFLAFAAIWGSLAVALHTVPRSRSVLVGRVLFILAMLAIIFASAFPETADPRTGSALSRIQNIVARPGLFLGVILVSLGLRRAQGWEGLGMLLVVLALFSALLLIVTIWVLLGAGLGGVGQRIAFVTLYTWTWLVARATARAGPGYSASAT